MYEKKGLETRARFFFSNLATLKYWQAYSLGFRRAFARTFPVSCSNLLLLYYAVVVSW